MERSVHDGFVEKLAGYANALKVGDPLDLASDIGVVASERQLLSNLQYVAKARAEGEALISGGARLTEDSGGFYMAPTVIGDVVANMSVFKNEVFGPLVTVTPFDTEAEAIELANDTELGLAAGVWTANLSCAHRMIRAIKAGVVHVNTYGGADATVPLAGMKQSGNGADKSLHELDKYCNLKIAWIQL